MEKPSVYIESSVISYFTARRPREIVAAAHQEITIDWWEEALTKFEPFISQFVIDEISRGDSDAAEKRLTVISLFKVLAMTSEVASLANKYYVVLNIPENARTDTYHIALSVFHGMDYLVTWNCKHIAAGRVRAIIEAINSKLGYFTPTICTPEELMEV